LSKKGVAESITFTKIPDVLVFKVMQKMFTAAEINTFESFSKNCVPETIEDLRAEYIALEEPSFLSKKHWSRVVMNGSVLDKILYKWLGISYHLDVAKLTRNEKLELQQCKDD